MTEHFEPIHMNEHEAELTKIYSDPTLGRATMEDSIEQGQPTENDISSLNNEIISIVERRRERGQDHAEFEASKKVWETFLEGDLNRGNVLKIVGGKDSRHGSVKEAYDNSPEGRAELQENLQRVMDDPRKFEAAISVLDGLDRETIMKSLSGERGKFVVGLLAAGLPHEEYQEKLDKILRESNDRALSEIKGLLEKIKADVKNVKDTPQPQEGKMHVVYPNKKVEAREAWEREVKRKKMKGEELDKEYIDLMEYAIARGKTPEEYNVSGGALGGGDNLFSHMDETAYANPNIQTAVLKLREAGEENVVNEQLIKEVRDELRNDLKSGSISVTEYERVKEDIRELTSIYKQRKEAKSNPAFRSYVSLKDQQHDWTPLDALITSVLQYQGAEEIDMPGNLSKEEKFSVLRQKVAADENVEKVLSAIYASNPVRATSLQGNWADIENTTDFIEYRSKITEFLQDLKANFITYIEPPEDMSEQQKESLVKSLLESGETTKKGIRFKIGEWMKQDSGVDVKELIGREPQNIKELAYWIMMTDDASIWSPDGPLPLVELKKTGRRRMDPGTGEFKDEMRGEFRKDNFVLWLRNKMIEHHNDNSNDAVSFLQQVAIQTLFRPVSILEMKYNKQRYFADPDTGAVDGDLYGEIINEAWLFGVRRNNNLVYIQSMNSDEDLFKQLIPLNAKNEHTTGKNLVDYVSMASNFGNEGDNKTGDALLTANIIYRNISDLENLKRLLPEGSPLFSLESFKKAIKVLSEKGFDEEATGYGSLHIDGNRIYHVNSKTKVVTEIFNSEGEPNEKDLIKFMNVFTTPNSDQTTEEVVRELVKQTVAHMLNIDDGTTREGYEKFKKEKMPGATAAQYLKLSRINLEFAETNSWVEQRWNGQAARNDTGYRGYDAWTKMYAQYYRERQSQPGTNGPIGNPNDIQIFKMLSPDMWLALRTESGQAAQEIFEEIHHINRDLYAFPENNLTEEQQVRKAQLENQKKEVYSRLRFPRNTQLDWASNAMKRQAEVWHAVLDTEDLGFDKLVTRNNWGVLKYSRGEFEKVVKDGFIKIRRYAFKSNNAINYGALTRSQQRTKIEWNSDGTVKSEEFAYKDMTVADAMFGDVVMKSVREGWYLKKGKNQLAFKYADEDGKSFTKSRENASFQDYLNSDEAREVLLKSVCRAGLAAQLKGHRSRTGTGERWNPEMVRKFYESLRSMPQYIQDPETGKEIAIPQSQFFSLEDIEWIKEQTGTSDASLLMEDARAVGWDMIAGIPEIFGTFFKGLMAA